MLEVYDLSLPHRDLVEIQDFLRDADVLTTPTQVFDDNYSIVEWIRAADHSEIEVSIILDNNIFTRVSALTQDKRTFSSPEDQKSYRLAAAVMAFSIQAGFSIEPGLALYEKASSGSHENSAAEYRAFQIGDETDPTYWSAFALGRDKALRVPANAMEQAKQRMPLPEKDLTKDLRHHSQATLYLMKLLELKDQLKNPSDIFIAFILWMEQEALPDFLIALFAIHFLSEKTHSRSIKNSSSRDPKLVFRGLQNAAWDITYVRIWSIRAKHDASSRYWLFCSNDRHLQMLARHFLTVSGVSIDDYVGELFTPNDAQKILSRLYDAERLVHLNTDGSKDRQRAFWDSLSDRISHQRIRTEKLIKQR